MDQSVVETKSVIRLKYRTLWIVCLALLGALLALHISSYFMIVSTKWTAVFILIFPAFGLAIIDYNSKNQNWGNRAGFKKLIKVHIRPWMVIVAILLAINFAIHFFSLMSFDGVPEVQNGIYIMNDHGTETVISYETYRNAMTAQTRMAMACAMWFLYLSFAYFFSRKTRLDSGAR